MPSDITERCNSIWHSIRKSPTQLPTTLTIDNEHVHDPEMVDRALQPDEDYFQVLVNEMYLSYDREWFKAYTPMVFSVAEFTYDGDEQSIPFVVGPSIIEKYGHKIPKGMVFSNTRVAGIHPYRGDRLSLCMILYRLAKQNYADELLRIVEKSAGALDFSSSLGSYLKIADVVLDGVEALLGLGNIDPIVGYRIELNEKEVRPGYFALINMPEEELDISRLWVDDKKLLWGNNLKTAKPFRKADYVLFSLTQLDRRTDLSTLSFYPSYNRVIKFAQEASTASLWEITKAFLADLRQLLRFSPDLTQTQYEELRDKYRNEAVKEHQYAVDAADLSKATEMDADTKDLMAILDL